MTLMTNNDWLPKTVPTVRPANICVVVVYIQRLSVRLLLTTVPVIHCRYLDAYLGDCLLTISCTLCSSVLSGIFWKLLWTFWPNPKNFDWTHLRINYLLCETRSLENQWHVSHKLPNFHTWLLSKRWQLCLPWPMHLVIGHQFVRMQQEPMF